MRHIVVCFQGHLNFDPWSVVYDTFAELADDQNPEAPIRDLRDATPDTPGGPQKGRTSTNDQYMG